VAQGRRSASKLSTGEKMSAVVQVMTAGLDRRINTSPSGAEQPSQRGIDNAPLGCRARTSGATRRCPQPSLFGRQRALARAVPEPEKGMRFDPSRGQSAAWTDGAIRVPRTADKAAAPALRLSNGPASRSGRKPDGGRRGGHEARFQRFAGALWPDSAEFPVHGGPCGVGRRTRSS